MFDKYAWSLNLIYTSFENIFCVATFDNLLHHFSSNVKKGKNMPNFKIYQIYYALSIVIHFVLSTRYVWTSGQ